MSMEDIRGRFRTYSESFPEDAINLKDDLQKIETEVESAFMKIYGIYEIAKSEQKRC
jgi:hypothetical protein